MGQRAAKQSTALALFEALPQRTRVKLDLVEVRALTGAVTIKDRIQLYYQEDAARRTVLRRFKRHHGYCGGLPSCLAYTGEEKSMCSSCRALFKGYREGVSRYKRKLGAYGQMREKERAQGKAERERQKGGA